MPISLHEEWNFSFSSLALAAYSLSFLVLSCKAKYLFQYCHHWADSCRYKDLMDH